MRKAKKGIQKSSARVINFSIGFNIVFITVTTLTLISGAGALCLSLLKPEQCDQITLQERLFEQFCFSWHAGFGAIIGLLGGKMSK